ncbi:hypothetical protein EDD21DRAFT_429036 [Dissophora ornata]|nr:hypothetical protein EDD21DRAFT_429036 [Dissophora ornata]
MVRRYLAHETVVIKKPDPDRFDPALKVFCRRELTIPDPPAAPHGLDADARLQELLRRLTRIRDVMDDRRQQTSDSVPTVSEGNVELPNRFRIVDRPPKKRPPPHKSGRRYKHRPRYDIKARTRMLEHEPPKGFKKYKIQPWKQREPSPSDNTATSTISKKSQNPYNPRPASEAARTLQCGIGMYFESLSARKVDEMDKLILRKLCPDFTAEEITAFNDSTNQQQSIGQGQDQEHDQSSQSKYNE